jgi:F0F1-type ATP synthase assembly protein I
MQALRQGVRRVVLFQALLTLLLAAGFAYLRGRADFLSALYGGGSAILLSAWLGLGVWRARGLGSLYANFITRYGIAVLCLGLGLGVLKLAALPLIGAFAVAQFGFLANVWRATDARREEPD